LQNVLKADNQPRYFHSSESRC